MPREYFCAFHSYREKTATLTDEQFGRVMRAALLYSETGEVPVLDPAEEIAFSFIKFDIDQQAKNYAQKCEKARSNVQKRYGCIPSNTDVYERTQTKSESESKSKSNIGEGTSSPALSPAKSKKAAFTPPTVDEVRAYCRERGSTVDAEQFVAFYESKGWLVGKSPMKSWKAALITWEKRDQADGKRAVPIENDPNEVIMPF